MERIIILEGLTFGRIIILEGIYLIVQNKLLNIILNESLDDLIDRIANWSRG